MRLGAIGIAIIALSMLSPQVGAQDQAPSESLQLFADRATTWTSGQTQCIQLGGSVSIRTDLASMSSTDAVVWITPVPGTLTGQQQVQIALLGSASLQHENATRSGERLLVNVFVRGKIELTVEERLARDTSDSVVYQTAISMRPPPLNEGLIQNKWITPPAPTITSAPPTTQQTRVLSPVTFEAGVVESTRSADGKLAYVLSKGARITQERYRARGGNFQPADESDVVELFADRAVVFTALDNLRDIEELKKFKSPQEAVYAAYLEGDVRIIQTPAGGNAVDQRLEASRVFYDFTTDRAVLTDAVIHAVEPRQQIPIIVRASLMRQLSMGEFRADNAVLTTSSFAVPSYSLNAASAYVRQVDTGDPRYGNRITAALQDTTFRLFDVPFFYLPRASGSFTERGFPLRGVTVGNADDRGAFVQTEWGLFETLGKLPPQDLDAWYRLDYYTERGFATGLNADYRGGFITQTTRQAWDFEGDLRSYFVVNDDGSDKLGRDRRRINQDGDFRGNVLFEHQHFFPSDWQMQIRYGWLSDPTYLEEWFPRQFDQDLPYDFSVYLKRQKDNEALSLLYRAQPNDFVTTSNQLQEVYTDPSVPGVQGQYPLEVERLPELAYHRVGDSVLDDNLSYFGDINLSVLKFDITDDSLSDYGFQDPSPSQGRSGVGPGVGSPIGTTGVTGKEVYRADFRNEFDYPVTIGQFKMVPFIMTRWTAYSDSPEDSSFVRQFFGAGIRISTSFWKVNDRFESRLFDIHRIRHVIEPSMNIFASGTSKDRSDVFIYDQNVDGIYDISALQVALRQRWQTKRGGPGNWRSVDFFTVNVEANLFTNQPDNNELPPGSFRGLYFTSVPEASVPRTSLNGEVLWRISDTTVVMSDAQWNMKEQNLATTSIGLAVQRDTRLTYFFGVRYIGDITSTIASFASNYQLSTKYSLATKWDYNLSDRDSQDSSFSVVRRFDRFYMSVNVYYDHVEDSSGVSFSIYPEGFGAGVSSEQLNSMFGGQP